jgi:cellulose synthase/poly-beta-1,6-N-acetylglucosamine synthase-like glycosyltransferase
MPMAAEVIFWGAVALLVYTHAGYPLLLWAWARLRPRAEHCARCLPRITVLVVANNEAANVYRRLENLLALDYPRDRLEIILASDGSDDATLEQALAFRRAGVMVVTFGQRRGKSAVLNDLVPQADGEIVVLADARQRFERGALRALAAHFADPTVGAVSGELILDSDGGPAVGEGVGFYWKYEKFIRRSESRVDSTVGVTGAIYALRRELFEPIPRDTILDDVLIPMTIVRRGYRVVFESAALAYDRTAPSADAEFTRKVRTLAGNFQLFTHQAWLLNPFANRLWLQTVSHKGCRLLSPMCLGAALGANLLLLEQPLYQLSLAAQLALYLAAAGGYTLRNSATKIRLCNVAYAFLLLNWATAVGFMRFVSGAQRVTWVK